MEETDPLIGETIAGYKILDVLGRGGMGVVYKATQISLDRTVAIKILPGEYCVDPEYIRRFQKEARSAARLNHPHITQIYDFGLEGQLHYLTMEYIDGHPLSSYLKAYGRLMESDLLRIMIQVCEALDCAHHAGIIHRDIKPDNILMAHDGGVKLCDLGLAKLTSTEDLSLTQTGMAIGTPYYISPEQVRGDKILDPRTDIYSLGATLFHAATGRIPFEGPSGAVVMSRHLTDPLDDPRGIQADLSYEMTCLIHKMMAKNPDDRYSTALEVRDALQAIMDKPATPVPVSPESSAKFIVSKKPPAPRNPPADTAQIAPASPDPQAAPSQVLTRATRDADKEAYSLPLRPAAVTTAPTLKFKSKEPPAPPAPQKSPSHKIMSISIIILVLIAVAVATAFYFFNHK